MSLNVICGPRGSGKSRYLTKEISRIKKSDKDAKIYILVPEQFSFVTEKSIAQTFDGTGLNGIEVVNFSKLSKLYKNRAIKDYLMPSGKVMLIQNAINRTCIDENIYSGCVKKTGFSKIVSKIISEFKRYTISPQILLDTVDKYKDKILKEKIKAIYEIYKVYDEENKGKFIDSDDDLITLSKKIINENYFDNSYFFIDEFAFFLPQHYLVIEALLKKTNDVYITLPIDNEEDDIFKIPNDTNYRLNRICQKNNIKYNQVRLDYNDNYFNSEELKYLYKNYNAVKKSEFKPYDKKTKDIKIFASTEPYSEIEYVAEKISELVENENVSYRDISVVYGNGDNYNHIIEAVFPEYNIPYFSDKKTNVAKHPIVTTILGVFEIFDKNWSYESVFRFLKNGFIYFEEEDGLLKINTDDVDLLENYVRKRGIKGRKKWISEDIWDYNVAGIADSVKDYRNDNKNESKTKKINELRKKIILPIENFRSKLYRKNNVEDFSKALFEFLEEINLRKGLILEIEYLNENGFINEAQQYKQVWDTILEVINQSVVTLKNIKCTKDEYAQYIKAGFSECEISIIPTSLDAVTVCNADFSTQKNINTLFIVGALRGDIPKEETENGIFTDRERTSISEILNQTGLELAKNLKNKKIQSEFNLFRLLSVAKNHLYVSYCVNNLEGEVQIPSELIYNLSKLFENLDISDNLSEKSNFIKKTLPPKAAFNYLLENRNNKNDSSVQKLYRWFLENDEWKDKIEKIKKSEELFDKKIKISEENAKELYKKYLNYSVSRISEFTDCPFKYFISNGLKARPQEIWQIQKFDLGTLMHYAVLRYCQIIENGAKTFDELKNNWKELTKEKSDSLVDDIMSELKPKILDGLDRDEGKIKYLIDRMTKTIKRSVETVRMSLNNGQYVTAEHEKSFLVALKSNGSSVNMEGKIDRIDVTKLNEATAGIRIIDYKSGKKDFSVVSISNMQDIQLVVYSMCAIDLYDMRQIKYLDNIEKAKITGMMYNKLRDDMIDATDEDVENIDTSLNNDMKLNGPVILDEIVGEDGVKIIEYENAYSMDDKLIENKASEFLNIGLTQKGELKKTSDYFTRDEYNKLVEYVKYNIINVDKLIKEGNIDIKPYKNGTNLACSYCDMAEICLFDEEKNEVRNLCTKKDEAWEKINKTLEK